MKNETILGILIMLASVWIGQFFMNITTNYDFSIFVTGCVFHTGNE